MVTVEGKGGIRASVVADSISGAGIRITTFELEYPRFIHSEFMTHRMFSRNAASSRAIPIERMIEQVENNPAMPIHWGKNQSGMQAKEELKGAHWANARAEWVDSSEYVVQCAKEAAFQGLHKQIVNRILEPYQMIKVVCTATEYENFFYLRDHPDAQPEIAELARCMREAKEESCPQLLKHGEWHLPYINSSRDVEGKLTYEMPDDCEQGNWVYGVEDPLKLSASLCAQVSYRKADESLEKALKIYDQLVTMKPVHASPFEHQATPMGMPTIAQCAMISRQEVGVTHQDSVGAYWSGNFRGWIQNRQLISGHVYNGEK